MATLFRARWVLSIAHPPMRDAWVLTRGGVILATGGSGSEPPHLASLAPAEEMSMLDLGAVAIMPGLVNAHTHLELSWMRGRVPPAGPMPEWAARLMALRRPVDREPPEPMADAVREVRAAGTALVGDVTNTLSAYDVVAASGLGGAIFCELLGFNAPDPASVVEAAEAQIRALPAAPGLRASVVPHAPYSVSPALLRAIAAAAGVSAMSVHVGESAEEIRFLRDGTGPWRDLLSRLGVWTDAWTPPGCGPIEYLDRLGLVTSRLLAVHGTQLEARELARLAQAGATVVACPRSNRWTGAGTPPIDAFYASGVRVAVGTDSLASVEDLNVFAELAALRRLAPAVPASRLLASATRDGAAALGFEADFGTIEPGKRASLIAVTVPTAVADVEEYLLSGIEPDRIRWLD